MKYLKKKNFANGCVYLLETDDGYPVEVTDTFLPYYTKDSIGKKQNALSNSELGSRKERWMIGVSVMSGCPVGCKFCATGRLHKCRNLTAFEISEQIDFIVSKHGHNSPKEAMEFKINYTRMGEPFLNIDAVKTAIEATSVYWPNTHHYVSTIGVKGSDFSFVKDNVTLQFSIHSFSETYRNWLIPYHHKMTLKEMGAVRTKSNLKTTLNLTLVNESDFNVDRLVKWFPKEHFFVKLSPINPNEISDLNDINSGVIKQTNLI